MKKFYRRTKVFFIFGNLIFLAGLILALAVSGTEEKIAMIFNFVFAIAVSSFLMRYYKNLVAEVCLEGETVCVMLSDERTFRYDRAECTGIEIFGHLIKLYFKDGRVFSMPRYFLFKKFDFVFSIFDQHNFPNAKIKHRI